MNRDYYAMHEVITFTSLVPGPKLLVFGAIHGDEICGPAAIRLIVDRLQKGLLTLKKGSVTFVPVCNPLAYALGKRYAEKNLNRVITPKRNPKLYEEKLAQHLLPLIKACDYLLDLHAYPSQGPAFVFEDASDPKTKAFVRCLGPKPLVTGWDFMYSKPGAAQLNAGDTISYAHTRGKTGAVIECGPCGDPKGVKVASTAITNTLAFLGLIKSKTKATKTKHIQIKGTGFVIKKKQGTLSRTWKHLDRVKKGQVIATYKDGSQECAPHDGFIMLPNATVALGEEWFYFGL